MKTPRALCLALLAFLPIRPATASDMFVYFGSHSFGPGIGFSLARFDTETGALTKPAFLIEAREPAFFVLTPDGSRLYTCNSGTPGGLSAYAVEPHTGRLTLINRVLAGGGDTSFITLDRTGRYVLVANYDGGNVAVFALRPDGAIGDWTGFDQHTGRSVNPRRQAHAYAHAIVLDPTNRFVLVPDLGVDRLYIYRFDGNSGALTPNEPAFAAIAPGSGPRHVRFHPNGRWVYLINEIASTIIAFSWDSTNGRLAPFQTITTLPADFKGVSACAELEIHPNGRLLYCSNRGDDSLAGFAIDQDTGRLTPVEHVSSGGKSPRNFAFDPTGRWIIVTNHDSDNALVFRVDTATGRLTRSGDPVTVPSPYCERFLPVR
ncbi:MAG: lactonase family protein [Opitutaceae bacterium]|jgi:6-phosphogluconolactonase